MIVTENTIDAVATDIRRYLCGSVVVYIKLDRTFRNIDIFGVNQKLDQNAVNILTWGEGDLRYISFSISLNLIVINYQDIVIFYEKEGVKIYQDYPLGNNVLHWIKRQ